jgi:sialate O-acetylesterase
MKSLLVVIVVLFGGSVFADVTLPHVFSDHMVLQREKPVRVWGWAEPGEQVTITLKGKKVKAVTNRKGKWQAELPAMNASLTPVDMHVSGNNTVVVKNILVGDVWLCSGQSNMEWGLGQAESKDTAIPAATNSLIRLLKVTAKPSPQAIKDMENTWQVCSPQTIPHFSAAGYFFGKKLHEELDVPIGLIQSAWGGTRIEPWIPAVGFKIIPSLEFEFNNLEEMHLEYRASLPDKLNEINEWIKQAKQALAERKPVPPQPEWPRHPIYSEGHPVKPTCLYNSRIHPLIPFGIRGVIWYQGESNVNDDGLYFEKMKALIKGWRRLWNQGNFPFYYVQIAPGGFYQKGKLPELWEEQIKSLKIPNTGMAVIHDIGNLRDIHPRNKRDVGGRLALWALAKEHGREGLVYSGPLFKGIEITGDKIIVLFDHTGSGLATRDGKAPNWFEITGEDKQFVKADADIQGGTVVVSSKEVAKPVAVRFAWDEMAEPNLVNKEGLPASPFRSDNW